MPTEYEHFIDTVKELVETARTKRGQEVKDSIFRARAGEDPERAGYIAEFAIQYGFEFLDEDCEILVCSYSTLADVMSVMGFRKVRKERETYVSQDTANVAKKEEHMLERAPNQIHEEEKITRDQIIRLEAMRAALARSNEATTTDSLIADADKVYQFLSGAPKTSVLGPMIIKE